MTIERQRDKATPAVPSGYLIAAVALLVLAPVAIFAWVMGTAALRYGARRWVLALCGAVPLVVAAVFVGPRMATTAGLAGAQAFGAVGTATITPSVGALLAWCGRWAWLTAPLGVPAGMVVAAVPPPQPALPRPEWEAQQRRAADRAEARTRRKAARWCEREGRDLTSNALGRSLGGMVASWRIGEAIVPPPGQLGLAWLLIGAPGTGKSVAQCRIGYLAGLERRHLVVVDAKGGHDGLARDMIAAYLAAWPDARVRTFPNERLDIWRGDAQAIVNRLVEVWDWGREPYWREVATIALRMALGQPGPPCHSGDELVRRLQPSALARAWDHDPDIRALVQDMTKKGDLGGVHVRVMNLVAALAGALDGDWSWEDCDLAVVTVPSMVASTDADSALRVILSDYGHFTMARKPRGQPSLLMVDEFSAIAGGRRLAIDLLERGRGAGAGVVLAAQSSVALGNEEERSRLRAAASAILVFRTPEPAELAALAGTERVAEGAWQVDGDDLTGRATITTRSRARVDQDAIRQLPTGECDLIVRGLVERVAIIRTKPQRETLDAARGLTELCAAAPARPVDAREVPAPPAPRQGATPAPRPPSAGLDPSPAPRVRRHRPPPVGGAGGASPDNDRNNQEGTA